jgi:class 3 adenylate cyclase/tetratricopeptide (TPR) repeat protein
MTNPAGPLDAQILELQQAIATLEAQRDVLGPAVIQAALPPLQARLAALQGQAAEQRKLVSVLFADLAGFTALSEDLDPEDIRDLQQDYFARWRAAIERHGGVVEKFIGDAVMALFGVPTAQEDDAERAVRAALALHGALAELNAARGTQLQMRAGVNTGPVVVAGSAGDYVATGDTVNLTARLQAAAPPGGVLISHETYAQVRGLFDVVAQPPLSVKGKSEPITCYLVERARPGGFRAMTRGVEGVETRMVGREAEILVLQKTYADAVEDGTAHLVLVVGEPGLGKSRLADEFGLWLVDQDERLHVLRGRAAPQSAGTPAAVLRDLFGQAFGIHDHDSGGAMRAKFRSGVADLLDADEADILGEFCGFDFSSSPAVERLLGQDALAHLGRDYVARYLDGLGRQRPVLLIVEDLHWADDRSLDALLALVSPGPLEAPLLVVALTRPALFERRPHLGEGLASLTQLKLKPLSRREGRFLVTEILQRVEQLPDDLRDLIVTASEGNPFFAEELVKMLVDDGVILVEAGRWRVAAERLGDVRVPPTLAGVLQARLDSLPTVEREALQRAAVVGREFWDDVVARLGAAERDTLAPVLSALRSRELVYRHEQSAFDNAAEYAFKHALLRDVTYETVLRRLRRTYHLQVAEWLEQRAGERAAEYAGLIAYHYQQAEAGRRALKYLGLAADVALSRYANREAAAYYRQALEGGYVGENRPSRASLLDGLGRALNRQDDYTGAIEAWSEAVELYLAAGDTDRAAWLYARMARAAWYNDDFAAGLTIASGGLERLRHAPVSPGLAALHHEVGRAAYFNDHFDLAREEIRTAMDMAEEIGATEVLADALTTWAFSSRSSLDESVVASQRAAALAEQTGVLSIAQRAQHNVAGRTWQRGLPGDLETAIPAIRRAIQLAQQRGSPGNEMFHHDILISLLANAGDLAGVRQALAHMERLARSRIDVDAMQARLQAGYARYYRYAGDLPACLAHAEPAMAYFTSVANSQAISDGCWHLGTVCVELGRIDEAETYLRNAIRWVDHDVDDVVNLGARAWLGAVVARKGQIEQAETLLAEASELASRQHGRFAQALILVATSRVAVVQQRWDAALAVLGKLVRYADEAAFKWLAAFAVMETAVSVHMARSLPGDRELACGLLEDALDRFEQMGAYGYVQQVKEHLSSLG